MVRISSRLRDFNEESEEDFSERRSSSSPLKVHFMDYKNDEDLDGNVTRRMTPENAHNRSLSIIPPSSPRLGSDLYASVSLFQKTC